VSLTEILFLATMGGLVAWGILTAAIEVVTVYEARRKVDRLTKSYRSKR